MNKTAHSLTEHQAFEAMRLFLEDYFVRTQSEDVGSLLGDLHILEDGEPSDPAAWDDWLRCLRRVMEEAQ